MEQQAKASEDEDGLSPFLRAVRSDTPEAVARVVDTLGDGVLGECTPSGTTCLHLAAERRDWNNPGAAPHHLHQQASAVPATTTTMMGFLFENFGGKQEFPIVDARDRQSFTPLHVACMHGDVGAARELLRRGAAVGAANERGSTPLHWAASRGHAQVVKLLVGMYGADFAAPAGNGSTPLHWAASKGKRAVIEILLGIFCAQVDVKDDKGCTPCLMAALNGHLDSITLLIDRFDAKITVCDRKRTGLLHAACEMGHGDVASALIDRYHMDVESKDRKGLTPLARAAQRNQVETFRILVDRHGARVDTVANSKGGLLHVACEAGALDVAKLLLEDYRFEVEARNASGDTPALLAASRGHANVLALLVDGHGASVEAADAKGIGALHVACERRHSGMASALLESYGLPADKADPSGSTALHVAARGGDPELVELLTGPTGRADIRLRDGEGNQPLHIAAACGHLEAVKVLVEKAGADLGARDRYDKSPLDVAVGTANTEIADYLREVLPQKHREEHLRCKRRAGFERAGRLMRLSRASGCLQDLALENVHLLPVAALLEAGRFPSHYDASRKKLLVAASTIPPHAQVLLVSHPWESPGNPDPSGKQFVALRRFLKRVGSGKGDETTSVGKEEATGGAGGEPGGFGYVWLSFSCTSSNRMKPAFQTHLNNLLTAWCFSDHVLIIPETVTRPSEGFTYTDVERFVERGWCCAELLCVLHLGVPTTLYVALTDAGPEAINMHHPPHQSKEQADLEPLPPTSVFEPLLIEECLEGAGCLRGKISSGDESLFRNTSENANGLLLPSSRGGKEYSAARDAKPEGEFCQSDGDDGPPRLPLRFSTGKCMRRAIERASRRLLSYPRDVSSGDATHPSAAIASHFAQVVADNCRTGTVSDESFCLAKELCADGSSVASVGGSRCQHVKETEESKHIAKLIWSPGAEAHLDSISRLVADVLTSLNHEVSRDIEASTATSDGAVTSTEAMSGGKREVPESSKAGLLLGRVLNLGLGKQDVEEDESGEEALASPMVRELYESLGSFSSTHDRLDAVKTLLLAGCYFKGVRTAAGISSRGPSSSSASRAPRGGGLSPTSAAHGAREQGRYSRGGGGDEEENRKCIEHLSGVGQRGNSSERDRNPRLSSGRGEGKMEGAGGTTPILADSVPSCHVS